MSQPSSVSSSLPKEKQPTNVYTVMLILSFVFLVTGSLILSTELNKFGTYPWWKTGVAAPATSGS